jgi:hypothetical protein
MNECCVIAAVARLGSVTRDLPLSERDRVNSDNRMQIALIDKAPLEHPFLIKLSAGKGKVISALANKLDVISGS